MLRLPSAFFREHLASFSATWQCADAEGCAQNICEAAVSGSLRMRGGFECNRLLRTVMELRPRIRGLYRLRMTKTEYLAEYDGIVKTVQMYIDGSKQGKSELMRPAFHPDASFFGYAGEQLAVGEFREV